MESKDQKKKPYSPPTLTKRTLAIGLQKQQELKGAEMTYASCYRCPNEDPGEKR